MQTLDEFVNSKKIYSIENFHEIKFWELLYLTLGDEKEKFLRIVFSDFLPVAHKLGMLNDQNNHAKAKTEINKLLSKLEAELDIEPYNIVSYIYEKPIFEALNFLRNYPIKQELSFYQSSLTNQEKELLNSRKSILEDFKDLQNTQNILEITNNSKFVYRLLLKLRPFLKVIPAEISSKGIKNNFLELGSIFLKDYLRRVIFYTFNKLLIEQEQEPENKNLKSSKLTMPQKNLIMHFLLSRHEIENGKGKETAKLIQDLCEIEGFENLYKAVRNPFETNDKNWRREDLIKIKPYFENLGMDAIVKEIENQKRK